jgi:hypothetical protein
LCRHSKKKNLLTLLYFCALVVTHRCLSSTLSPSPWDLLRLLQAPSQSCDVQCFSMGTNYHDLVSRMRLHMCGLRLWKILTGELPCPPSPSAPAKSVITEKTTAAEKEMLIVDYDDRLTSYESQFGAYTT